MLFEKRKTKIEGMSKIDYFFTKSANRPNSDSQKLEEIKEITTLILITSFELI